MNALDLHYADPAPPADRLHRVRQQGQRIRRRRAGGAVAGIVAVALAGVLAAQIVGAPAHRSAAGPAASPSASPSATPSVDLSALPYSTGTDPSFRPPWGTPTTPVVWRTDATGKQTVTWFNGRGSMCIGDRPHPAAKPTGGCHPLRHAPAEGLWVNDVMARSDHGTSLESPDPVDTEVYGIVRGPVTRVVVDLPLSGATDVQLAPAPDGLGTVYWLTTRDFTIDGKVVGTAGNPGTADDNFPLAVTIYRGDRPVFHCLDTQCFGLR